MHQVSQPFASPVKGRGTACGGGVLPLRAEGFPKRRCQFESVAAQRHLNPRRLAAFTFFIMVFVVIVVVIVAALVVLRDFIQDDAEDVGMNFF